MSASSGLDLHALGARAVVDLRGQSRQLGSLWRNQPTVLVWLRHFGCLFCKEQAALIAPERDRIVAGGGRLAFVGHGGLDRAQAFHDEHVPHCAVFTDPSAYTYRALGATDGLLGTVTGFARHGLRAVRSGHTQTSIQGRPFLNGGVLVAGPGPILHRLHISREAGDHPPVPEVLAALSEAVETMRAAAAAPPSPARAPLPAPPSPRPPRLSPWPGAARERAAEPHWLWAPPSAQPPPAPSTGAGHAS